MKNTQLQTYIIHKRKHIKGTIYRTQNKHLRPFYHAGTLKLAYFDKLNILKEVFTHYGEGEYIILYFPPEDRKGFKLFWSGKLPTAEIIAIESQDDSNEY